jgi:radical SAM protein with 4Fe4S-binding SPASM domain
MRLDLLAKIIDEASQHKYSGLFSLGENGEALVNPDIVKAVRMIRQRFVSAKIVLFSNMILMDEKRAEELLKAGISVLHFNLDGNSNHTYGYVKGRPMVNAVKKNIQTFLRLRDQLNASCQIIIGMVPAKAYVELFEYSPIAFPDDRSYIEKFCKPLLRPSDLFHDETNVLLSKYQLPLNRLKHEPCDAFKNVLSDLLVAPDGRVYICCRDFRMSSNLGNIYTKSIADIWSGKERKELIKKLYLMNYRNIDCDCKTCLPYLGINEDLYFIIRKRIYKKSTEALQ